VLPYYEIGYALARLSSDLRVFHERPHKGQVHIEGEGGCRTALR